MNLELGKILFAGVKSIGDLFLKEIKEKMQDNNLTADAKEKISKSRNEIIGKYADIYEVKNGELKLYTKNSNMPEFIKNTDFADGFYLKDGENLSLDKNLTDIINEEIDLSKQKILEEEKDFLNSQKVKGEEYEVNEIGDSKKYVFLTRRSNGAEFQEFIPDELYYNLLKQDDKSNIVLIYDGEKYLIK